jgi:putative transposase
LVEVPEVDELDDAALFERIGAFYPRARAAEILQEFARARAYAAESGNGEWLDGLRGKYVSRMGDLSVFAKELKEGFSKWYNRRVNRRGTLWEERFKSVLVEDSDHAISTMAAYIDLNPVRAGIVEDPRDYRFCGYAEAVAGGAAARAGLGEVLHLAGQDANWRKVAAKYRMYLFSSGAATGTKAGFDPEHVRRVLDEGGELGRHDLLRCRVRYFSDGVALGSRLFVEEVFEHNRELFGERRKSGARKLRGGDWAGLCSLRDLRLDAVAAPG